MLIVLLLYLASQSWAKDVPHDTNYKFTNVTSCPNTGYFFKTVPIPNTIEGNCYLCFCQDDSTAICWQRENRKCDTQHYKHNRTVARKETRVKRSPLGLADIFFKDAARDIFNRKEEEVCKPYESSFSEGCPPADWCLGCTVCDCDAHGHWDCHILSFCDDEKKDHKKGSKKIAVSYPKPRKSTTPKIAKTTKKIPVRVKAVQKNTTNKPKPKLKRSQANTKNVITAKSKIKNNKGNIVSNNNKSRPKNKKLTKLRSVIQKGKPVKPLIIKKNDKNPKVIKSSPSKRVMNGSETEMSEAIMKKMKLVMKQIWNKQVTEAIPGIVNLIQKRSFPSKYNQSVTKPYNKRFKKVTSKPKSKPKPKPKLKRGKEHIYNKSLFVRKAAIEEKKKLKRQAEEKAAKAKKNNKGKKPAKRSKREIDLNNDSDLVAVTIIPEQFMTIEPMGYNNSATDNVTTETSTSPYIEMDIEALEDAINRSENMRTINEVNTTELSIQNTTNTSTDDKLTTMDTVSTPLIEMEFVTLADTTNSSTNTQAVNKTITTEPSVQNRINSSIGDNFTATDLFSLPRLKLDETGNSTYMQFMSNQFTMTEPPIYNGSLGDIITTTTEKITDVSSSSLISSAVISLDTAENSTKTQSVSNESIMIELSSVYNTSVDDKPVIIVDTNYSAQDNLDTAGNFTKTQSVSNESIIVELSSAYNSSVDDKPVIIVDTNYSAQDNLNAVTNSTTTPSMPVQTTTDPSLYNSSSDNIIISAETFSWPYIVPDAVKNSAKMQSTTEKIVVEPNELLDYSVLSVDYKLNVVPDTTSFDSAATQSITSTTTSRRFSETGPRDNSYESLVMATPMPILTISDTDSEIKVPSTSTQPAIETTTNVNSSSYIGSAVILNSSNILSSSPGQLQTISLRHNISAEDNNVTRLGNLVTDKNYYEYIVNLTIDKPENKIENSYNKTETNVITTISNANHIKPNIEKLKHNFAGEIPKHNFAGEIPNEAENEIKNTKWSEEKTFRDIKKLESGLMMNKTAILDKIKDKMNQTKWRVSRKEQRRKIHRKDIERKVDKTTKKYSLTRVVNSNLYKTKREGGIKVPDVSRISLSNKIENLRNVLKRLLSEFHKNNTLPNENKKKKTNAIKYLKRFFNKLFNNKNSNKTIISQRLRNNNHTIQMLCESFGPCVISKKNKYVLTKKIKELNNETIQILKSLRIIKGLLRLVDIPRSFPQIPLNETSNFRNDIHKLNVILKLKDEDIDGMKKYTETQRTQIDYIKSNTKVFKQSVARFTKVLNQIIDMVSIKGNKEKQRRWYAEPRLKQAKRNVTKLDTIKKFKRLLHNYNLVHNVFINKIIQIFSSLQGRTEVKNINNMTDFITKYNSEKIKNNLKKLKSLESALNQGRRLKRHAVRQDNGMEYLLMLMEYMLHQNYHTDAPPVNDGIDLLIEAIKNAPDIKTVKNKAVNSNQPYTASPQLESNFIPNMSKDDTALDTYIINDDYMSNKVDNSSSMDQDTQEDGENESVSQFHRIRSDNVENEPREKTLSTVSGTLSNDLDNNEQIVIENQDTENKFRTVSETFYVNSKESKETINKQSQIDNNNDFESTTEKPNAFVAKHNIIADFESRLQKASEESNNNKIFTAENYDDNNNVEETISVTAPGRNNEEDLTENPIKKYKSNTETEYLDKNDTTEISEKSKLYNSNETSSEWRDEKDNSYNNKNTIDGIASTTKIPTTSRNQNLSSGKKLEVALSDVSKESNEKTKVKVKKAEDVFQQKEEEFMNSLDYGGTDQPMLDETKEGNDDKFLNDYFAD